MNLKVAVHIGNPKLIAEAIRSYLGIEDLNTKNCALEGSKLFESTKSKLNLPLGSKYDSHCPDKVNYSIPHPNTRSMREHIDESFKHN